MNEKISISVEGANGKVIIPRLDEPFLLFGILCQDCREIALGRTGERTNGSSCVVCISAKKVATNEAADILKDRSTDTEREIRNKYQ